jgi:hypothetical protein
MMRLAMHVDYADGSGVDSAASAPDFIGFERHFDMPMQVFSESPRIEHMLWLAWHSLKRRNLTDKDFDAWIEDVDSVDFGDKESGEIVHLESTQPTG